MTFIRFMFSLVRVRCLLEKMDIVGEQHKNAVQDLTNTLHGNGVRRQFQPSKYRAAVAGLKKELGVSRLNTQRIV